MTDCGMPWMIEVPPEYQLTAPRISDAVPSVTMKLSMPKRVTTRPFTRPTTEPTPMPNSTPTISGAPLSAYMPAAAIDARPAVEPIDRSRWPATIGMSRPSVSTARTDWLAAMFWKTPVWLKTPEVSDQVL